jgi:TrmH family RNA methyltransferase
MRFESLSTREDALSIYNFLLLGPEQRERLHVVLVSPRNPLNIGAAARAMANFGFSHLTVVSPYEPHWREAQSAVGAETLLQNARKTETLADAVADCTLVLGTGTLTYRKPEQLVVPLPLLGPIIDTGMESGGHVAFVFGSEKRGLTRADLTLCHALVEIPTSHQQPSMNLAQAVAVCLYELSARRNTAQTVIAPVSESTPTGPGPRGGDPSVWATRKLASAHPSPPATSRDLDLLAEVISQTLSAANYSPAAMRNTNRHDLHLLLRRLAFSQIDARRALGFFRRILFKLHRREEPR